MEGGANMLQQIKTEKLIELINSTNDWSPPNQAHLLIRGDLWIAGDKIAMKKSEYGSKEPSRNLRLKNLVVTGALHLNKFDGSLIYIEDSNILGGLCFLNCSVESFLIGSCEIDYIDFLQCRSDRCYIKGVNVERDIDLSGLTLKDKLDFEKITYGSIQLFSPQTSARFEAPLVNTEDQIFTEQLRLLNIPVVSSTKAVQAKNKNAALQSA